MTIPVTPVDPPSPQPHYTDDQITLWHGDALATLAGLPDASVDCVVTSPPYYGLRDYGVPGQYGLEPTPAAYVDTMRAVFAEARRILTPDGTLWLNLGDSYAGTGLHVISNRAFNASLLLIRPAKLEPRRSARAASRR